MNHPGFCPNATMNQEIVSPQVAVEYLRANGVNRKLRPAIVKRYEEEMRQNSWTLSSDAIAFDCNGDLIQGQHRLNAVVNTGLPQVFWVARNMPKEAKENLDCGSKRELHDRLTISGHPISRTVGSACLLLITPWQKPNISKSKGCSPMVRSQVKTMHNHFYEELEWIDEQYGATSCNAAERAAGTMLLRATKDYELVKNYFSLVRKGENCNGLVGHGQKSPMVYRDVKNKYKALKKQTNDMAFYRLASTAAYNLSIGKDVHRLTSYANNPFTSAGIFRNISFLTGV
tara:strand:- start:3107 stop:3967 length:861 start_codon:yes stop_codon:yes gene_type:complete